MRGRMRWGCSAFLAATLIGFGVGCQPAGSSAGKETTPATTKPDKQPEKKDQPAKPPKPDVG